MPALRYEFNYANRILSGPVMGQSVGYYVGSEEVKYPRWLGFIDVCSARKLSSAKPVRLHVKQYSEDDMFYKWQDVPAGQCVHGCLVADGVYAIVELSVKFVPAG